MVVEPIVGDPEQPGRERRLRLPAVARGDHPLPDVLEELVGQRLIAQLPQQEPVQRAAMAGVQRLERGDVAARPGQHQQVVVGVRARIHPRQVTGWGAGREAVGCRLRGFRSRAASGSGRANADSMI